jgi:hypothetical protein
METTYQVTPSNFGFTTEDLELLSSCDSVISNSGGPSSTKEVSIEVFRRLSSKGMVSAIAQISQSAADEAVSDYAYCESVHGYSAI